MRRLTLLVAWSAVLVTGIVAASFASGTKADTRWALTRVGSLTWRLAVAAVVFALSLTPAGFLLESSGEHETSGPSLPVYSRDGEWMAFASDRTGKPEVYLARTGHTAQRVTHTEHGAGNPAWSPDGSQIVFQQLTGNEWPDRSITGLFVVNRDGSGLRRVTSGEDLWPCWTADGKTIVFARGDHVRAVGPDGTGGRRLVRNADMPACSPFVPTIAFVVKPNDAWRGVGIDIGILDLRTGRRRVLPGPADATEYTSPAWSPDGRRIAFEAQRARLPGDPVIEEGPWAVPWYFAELYTVSADGTSLTRLTENGVGDRWPSWTPDGRILFLSNRAGPDDLTNSEGSESYVMNADGTGVELFPWDPSYS